MDGDSDRTHREIELWTTRDGREIALDEMSNEHVASAIRVLSAWLKRLRRSSGDAETIADLTAAIDRFKRLERDRRRADRKQADGKRAARTSAPKPSSRSPLSKRRLLARKIHT